MNPTIKNLKITLQAFLTSAETCIPHNVLCSHVKNRLLVDQLRHLSTNIGMYVVNDSFIDIDALETVRDSLYDVTAVLAGNRRHPDLHRQFGNLVREVNMVRTLMHDPSMTWWNDYLHSFMGSDKPKAKRFSEIQPRTADA